MQTSVHLDPVIKQKFFSHKILYTIIKRLNFLQTSKYEGRVSNDTYEQTKNELLSNYRNLVQSLPNFDLYKFLQEFELQDQLFAKTLLEGKDNESDGRKSGMRALKFLSKLKELEDDFFVNRDDMKIGHFKPNYVELERIYDSLEDEQKSKLVDAFEEIREDINFVKSKGMMDRMTAIEYNNMQAKLSMFVQQFNRAFQIN